MANSKKVAVKLQSHQATFLAGFLIGQIRSGDFSADESTEMMENVKNLLDIMEPADLVEFNKILSLSQEQFKRVAKDKFKEIVKHINQKIKQM